MLSLTQRKAVYAAIKRSYTIEAKAFTPTVIHDTQDSNSATKIQMGIRSEAAMNQDALGSFIGTDGSRGQRSLVTVDINIISKAAQDLPAAWITQEMMRLFLIDVKTNWLTLSSGTIRLYDVSAVRDLTSAYRAIGIMDTYRLQVDVRLAYDLNYT